MSAAIRFETFGRATLIAKEVAAVAMIIVIIEIFGSGTTGLIEEVGVEIGYSSCSLFVQ